MVQEGTMQTFKGGRQRTVIPNYDTYDTCPAMHSNRLHGMKTQSSGNHTWMVTNRSPIEFTVSSTKGRPWFVLEQSALKRHIQAAFYKHNRLYLVIYMYVNTHICIQ